ncbi:MAG: EamA family transporter [Bacteroidales bacterium]
MWIFLGLISSFFLGIYDIVKKISLNNNAVIPVLFLASATGAILFTPVIVGSYAGAVPMDSLFYVPLIDLETHGLIFLKSMLVGSSWLFAYFALKNLPITIVTPIRATGPIWTLLGALIIYHETYNLWQWMGILTVLGFFYYFSLAGNREGINFKRNKWVLFIMVATMLGSFSTLYDKFLIAHYNRMAVQAWFSVYMIPVYIPFVLFMWYPQRKVAKFEWRWSIPFIGIILTIADFSYFYALTDDAALITILSVLRRSSVVIAFIGGALLFKEGNLKRKGVALIGIFIGVLMLVLGG